MRNFLLMILLTNLVGFVNSQDITQTVSSLSSHRDADTISIRLNVIYPENGYIIPHYDLVGVENGTPTELNRVRVGETNYRVFDVHSKRNGERINNLFILYGTNNAALERHLIMDANNYSRRGFWIFNNTMWNNVRRFSVHEQLSFYDPICINDILFLHDLSNTLYNYRLLREEMYNGKNCYVIEFIDNTSRFTSPFYRMLMWIGKDDNVIYKNSYFTRTNSLIKTYEIIESNSIEGRILPKSYKITFPNGDYIVVQTQIIRFNEPIPDRVFTPQYLETGR